MHQSRAARGSSRRQLLLQLAVFFVLSGRPCSRLRPAGQMRLPLSGRPLETPPVPPLLPLDFQQLVEEGQQGCQANGQGQGRSSHRGPKASPRKASGLASWPTSFGAGSVVYSFKQMASSQAYCNCSCAVPGIVAQQRGVTGRLPEPKRQAN